MLNMTVNLRTLSYNVCTPALFRYIQSKHVEEFFNDGTLRLSSLETFHRNKDEQKVIKAKVLRWL